jgi:hypothetical protein
MKKFLLLLILLLTITPAYAGDWTIHFDWVIPVQPNHGYGHGHNNGHNHNNGHGHNSRINCPEYYWQYGCNSHGFNCRVMPPQDCIGGRLTMPRPRHDHGYGHIHTWRCNQRHWHGHNFSHQHHADGHHEHGYNR